MTLVVVQNDRNVPVTIYAQNSVVEQKIGTVDAFSTATINIDDVMRWGADIEFFVQPAGEPECERLHGVGPRGAPWSRCPASEMTDAAHPRHSERGAAGDARDRLEITKKPMRSLARACADWRVQIMWRSAQDAMPLANTAFILY